MFEKVNPQHPDKIADRIAGAIVDVAYNRAINPRCAIEVLIGHGNCNIIIESSEIFLENEIRTIVNRIAGININTRICMVPQDEHLARNQRESIKCGDNGIFKGVPITQEEKKLSNIARDIYSKYPFDGKYIISGDKLIICQSNATKKDIIQSYPNAYINPLGDWKGGLNVDSGATNRKLGSDMAQSVTGGGIHGKDLSKADVSVNIWAFLEAQKTGKIVEASCAIGDDNINGVPYKHIVDIARDYIKEVGGFEKFAEWGLV